MARGTGGNSRYQNHHPACKCHTRDDKRMKKIIMLPILATISAQLSLSTHIQLLSCNVGLFARFNAHLGHVWGEVWTTKLYHHRRGSDQSGSCRVPWEARVKHNHLLLHARRQGLSVGLTKLMLNHIALPEKHLAHRSCITQTKRCCALQIRLVRERRGARCPTGQGQSCWYDRRIAQRA